MADLFKTTFDDLSTYSYFSFDVSVLPYIMNTNVPLWTLKCLTTTNCKVNYSREYTPLLYYMSPRVMYYGSETAFYVDPKNSMAYKGANEWPIQEARIDGHLLDFEGYLDASTSYSYGSKN